MDTGSVVENGIVVANCTVDCLHELEYWFHLVCRPKFYVDLTPAVSLDYRHIDGFGGFVCSSAA